MAQRGRCPGGRPSVSANKRIHNAYYSVVKWQLHKPSSIQNMISSLPESAVIRIGESKSIQQLINKGGDNSKIVGVGRRLSESLEQGLVMAPPRARMTNDRSTGVAEKVKLAGIGTGRRLLENKPQDAA